MQADADGYATAPAGDSSHAPEASNAAVANPAHFISLISYSSFHISGQFGIDRDIGVGIQAAIALDEPITATRGFEAGAVEGTMADGERAEDTVKKKKSDAKVAVHASLRVDRVMMNVVKAAGGEKPATKERVMRHPEIG